MRITRTRDQIAAALRVLGLPTGAIVFVHSSMSSTGYVEGGADSIVDALLRVLGPAGTLIVPTFTFSHARSANPVFDSTRDPSEMGRLTEVIRTRSGSRRSCHMLHSVAAMGAHAEEITAGHGPSAWAADGPFWKLYEVDAHILLLGVPYLRCTFFHVLEQLVQVPYRRWREVEARVQDRDGSQRPLHTLIYSPKPGFAGNDFNRLGALLEERGLVRVGSVGNSVVRLFRARDALEVGLAQYRVDPLLFVLTGSRCTPLRDGVLTDELNNEKSVLDSAHIYRSPRHRRVIQTVDNQARYFGQLDAAVASVEGHHSSLGHLSLGLLRSRSSRKSRFSRHLLTPPSWSFPAPSGLSTTHPNAILAVPIPSRIAEFCTAGRVRRKLLAQLPDFDLEGKVAVITGASRGIGAAIGRCYAAMGAAVVLSSRKQAALDEVADSIRVEGGRALAVAAHTGDMNAIDSLVQEAVRAFGGIDILVNNAATNPHFGPILSAEESHWQKILDVNVIGYFRMAKACSAEMMKRSGGKIINLASIAGRRPQPGMGVYCVSKAGVLMLTEVLAAELADAGIQVNAIAPGYVRTAFSRAVWDNPELNQTVLGTIPQKRIAEASELTGIALYLASDASSFTTGATFMVDGGQWVDAGLGG